MRFQRYKKLMKKFFIIFGIFSLAGSLALYYAEQVRLLAQYKLDVLGIKMVNFSLTTATLNIQFKITSYSNIEATVGNINFNLSVNGAYVGNAYQANAMVIPAMGFNLININLNIVNAQILNDILNVASAPASTPIVIGIDGTVDVKSGLIGMSVPVQTTYNTSLSELLAGV